MATATTALSGSIFIRVGGEPAREVSTFEVPVEAHLTDAEAVLKAGHVHAAMAAALRDAADRIEALPA